MISEGDVRAALRQVLKTEAVERWPVDFDFQDGAMDSLDLATFALLLDERHGVHIPDERLPELRTIRAVLEIARELTDR